MTTTQIASRGSNHHTDNPEEEDTSYIAVEAEEVYDGGYEGDHHILLRIANGGAGQSGLLREISDAFIKYKVAGGSSPFKVAWYKSDTTESIHYLKDGTADVAITYTPAAEQIAMNQNIAKNPSYYIFREHFLLVGPESNPANLKSSQDVEEMFSSIYIAAEAANTAHPVRFLSRYDKSATNIKDSELWIKIGQVPWATKNSPWYHQFIAYPIQALRAAAALGEYTLTDWGTYLSIDEEVQKQLIKYKKGTDSADDTFLLPAHLLIGCNSKNPETADAFAKWLVSDAGQASISGFKKKGEQVYSRAPKALDGPSVLL